MSGFYAFNILKTHVNVIESICVFIFKTASFMSDPHVPCWGNKGYMLLAEAYAT